MNINLDTWVLSDTHFYHTNIVKYCRRPVDHERVIAYNWRCLVDPEDTVLHLGDVAFVKKSGHEKLADLMASLPGTKYLILGNHDRGSDFYKSAGFAEVAKSLYRTMAGKRILFSHYPDNTRLAEWNINIHGHIHNNGYAPGYPMNRDYRNVSVEVIGYSPVRIRDILYNGAYQSRIEAGDWEPDLTDKMKEKGVLLPDQTEIEYYG